MRKYISQPGMEGGNAVADILSGVFSPCGKLTDTWAFRYEDYPNAETFSHNNGDVTKEIYSEGLYVGYRYFDSFDVPVRYGMGYGLSYTEFELTEDNLAVNEQGKISLAVLVTNTGKVPGKEVVQLYAALPDGDPGKGQGSVLGSSGISLPGSAGETSSCAREHGIANIVLADGPAGLRLNQNYYVKDGSPQMLPFEASIEKGFFYDGEEPEGEKYYQYCTAIPVGTLLAQTWNAELLHDVGYMIGEEMEHFGVTLWLAPGMNLHRNPLCGRNFEYYSEDPLLSGEMAAAITNGVQMHPGCGTTIKHFACNNQEDNRMHSDSILSERVLRELYLRPFGIAIRKSRPLAIMTSYNLINGIHTANSYDLCTVAARHEFGFRGIIVTDWNTTEQGDDCTAAGCIHAGNDLIMPGSLADHACIREALETGDLSRDELKCCVKRIIRLTLSADAYE